MPAAAPAAHASCRYLGLDEQVLTARGRVPVQLVVVGDWVMAGDGGWAAVTHTRRVVHRGVMVQVELRGGGRIRATRAMPLSVGPSRFAEAERLRVGHTVLVPVVHLPVAPAAPEEADDSLRLAWFETERTPDGHRTCLRTPWGHFLAEPPDQPPEDHKALAPTLAGRYRITPAGLVRVEPPPEGRRTTSLSEALGRHTRAVWQHVFPASPDMFHRLSGRPSAAGALVCEQSVSCRRIGDRIEFGPSPARPPPAASTRALPREVSECAVLTHTGWVFALTLAGAETFKAGPGLAMHFPQAPPDVSEMDIGGA